jgi:maltose alpha-D-glucosyltransferase/alpha-amylase
MVLGMMQEMVRNNSDTWTYMLDRLAHFNEHILSENKKSVQPVPELAGSLIEPVMYDEVPEDIKELLEGPVAERVRLLGIRTGEMHLALASGTGPDFAPEPFSLHYQRSLYSSFQSLVRRTFQNLSRSLKKLPQDIQPEAEEILAMRDDILKRLQQIYRKKIDVVKTRIHGDYHLGQTLFTGKDFVILDFEGEPSRSYSERRLKRSPLRDVAGMIRSFHYAAYGSLFLNNQIAKPDAEKLVPFVEQWYHYMRGFFVQAYFETVEGSPFVPKNDEDLDILMQAYVLEKSVYELNYELNNRPDWVIIPLRGIRAIMKTG